MRFDSELKGGLLVIGSLLWDEHETRVSLREQLLSMENGRLVPAPIRYGRKSDKRKTYTMVLSPHCKIEEKMGKGMLIPFATLVRDSDDMNVIARKIIVAEHKEQVSFTRLNWGWGCLAFLPNPAKTRNKNLSELISYWNEKISTGFQPSDYIVENEEPIITQQGKLLIEWKNEYGDLDFLVVTATKPNTPIPTAEVLARSFADSAEYFRRNLSNEINTYQDSEIQKLLKP